MLESYFFFLGGGKRVLGGLRLGGAAGICPRGQRCPQTFAGRCKTVAHVANADDDDGRVERVLITLPQAQRISASTYSDECPSS